MEVADCVDQLVYTTANSVSMPADIPTVVSVLQSVVDGLSTEDAQPPSMDVAKVKWR